MKSIIDKLLSLIDVKITRASTYKSLQKSNDLIDVYKLLHRIHPKDCQEFIQTIDLSQSQLWQDLFVLSELGFKKNGFFVEFGATDGMNLSNTFLLEKVFDWKGVLAEPARKWHHELKKNRSAIIENNCVWDKSNERLIFNETNEAEYSTIDHFSNADNHLKTRKNGIKYEVDTISLIDMLDKYNAPKEIDYLSIDTEGSEFEILSAFEFDKYKFNIITCEHNFTKNREKIFKLLTENGYERKYTDLSKYDDWYVLV